MPTPYLQKLHEDHGIPMEKLEAYWEKAKEIAKKGGKGYGYVVGILKNMLSLSEHVSLSDQASTHAWWKKLTKEQQREYLRKYPGSKFNPMRRNKAAKPSAPAASVQSPQTPAIPAPVNQGTAPAASVQSPQTPAIPAPVNQGTAPVPAPTPGPSVPPAPTPAAGQMAPSILGPRTFNLRKIMRRKYLKRRAKIAHTIRHHKRGMSAIKTLVDGGNVNERDYEQAKTTAALGLKLVAVAAIGVIAFTAFAPLIGPLAQLFLTDHAGASFSSESSDSEDFAASLADKMYDWLEGQDQETLMSRIEELKAKESNQ